VSAADFAVNGRLSKSNQQLIQTGAYKIEGEIIQSDKYISGTSLYSIEAVILPVGSSYLSAENSESVLARVDPLLPHEYYLSQNYPNPFNANTTITYALPEAGHVRIEIYDILGRNIATLIDENQPAGYNQVSWDATHNASGMYFYIIRTGEFAEAKKMLLVK
jgi:hypothetical protein